jgi:hypothetical protein|uniref:DUF551 domain-containing protein n=1 Tax=Herelleviridae sp. cttEB8 TaxID=2825832 RepID=A0A8S5P5W5_9CAUD|nr:MAG TPA: Protein of unknown function (DUF551) [Herelleviridae sp. cttEB8]
MKQTVEEAAKECRRTTAQSMGVYAQYHSIDECPNHGITYDEIAEAAFIKGAEWQSKQSPWISVEDAIPNEQAKGMCQVKYVDGSIDEMAMRKVNKWISPYIKTGYVTHWKPIPSFDEILEANKDVLERIKEKGD